MDRMRLGPSSRTRGAGYPGGGGGGSERCLLLALPVPIYADLKEETEPTVLE